MFEIWNTPKQTMKTKKTWPCWRSTVLWSCSSLSWTDTVKISSGQVIDWHTVLRTRWPGLWLGRSVRPPLTFGAACKVLCEESWKRRVGKSWAWGPALPLRVFCDADYESLQTSLLELWRHRYITRGVCEGQWSHPWEHPDVPALGINYMLNASCFSSSLSHIKGKPPCKRSVTQFEFTSGGWAGG